jgi:murein DD-endopeptidase MepM/ murein hydrolase activator NlpD
VTSRPDLLDTFGLRPIGPALAAIRRAVIGTPGAPKTRFGLSSARIFKPSIGLPTWLGVKPRDRRVPIYNLFNRVPAPKSEAYSVRVTFARDFLGGRYTYDGHLGTDFAVAVGTPVAAAAPGLVLRVANDLDRGGLKVCVDHGDGLFTTSNHLSRAHVRPGDVVARGEPLGLSGASGVEFVMMFPWVAPHLHYNVWLDGVAVDPFAGAGEISLWRRRNDPRPFEGGASEPFTPTAWEPARVDAAIARCREPSLRASMEAIADVGRRAAEVIVQRNYRAVLFDGFPAVYDAAHARAPHLDLPFLARDFEGASLRGQPLARLAASAPPAA